jgi:hypothetical protein
MHKENELMGFYYALSTFILLAICSISYGVFVWLKHIINFKDYKSVLFHFGFALTTLLLGLSLLFFYYPYNSFGVVVFILYIFVIYLGFILSYYFKTKKQEMYVLIAFTVFFLFCAVWKLISFTELSIIARLPLNVCNILTIFIFTRFFIKSKVLDNYVLCFALIAGIINFLIGGYYDNTWKEGSSDGLGFFHERVLEAALLHSFFLTYFIFTLKNKIIKVNHIDALKNMLWIVPIFIIFLFANQIWKTDFFFTGVYGATPNFLIDLHNSMPLKFTFTLFNFEFVVSILYSIFLLVSVSLILYGVSYLLEFIQKKINIREGEQNEFSI